MGEAILQKTRSAPGQKASSSACRQLVSETLVRTRSARARVRALKAFVSSESGARTRKRWWSVRASSARQKASKESDFPPAVLKRGRAAFSWLGWIGSTTRPASSKRPTKTPSERSIATRFTSSSTSISHSPWRSRSSWAIPRSTRGPPSASSTHTLCASLAQSIPAHLSTAPILLHLPARVAASPTGSYHLRVLVGQRSAIPARRPVAACWLPRTAGRRRLIVALFSLGG
jgi:hypothetical protein